MTLKGWILFALLVGLAALVKPSLRLDTASHEQPPGVSASVWDEDDDEIAGADGTDADRGTEVASRARSTDQAQADLPGATGSAAGTGVWDRGSPEPSRSATSQEPAADREPEKDRGAGEPTGSVTADAAQRAEPPFAPVSSTSLVPGLVADVQRPAEAPALPISPEPQVLPAKPAGDPSTEPVSAPVTVAAVSSAPATGSDQQSAERLRVSALEVDNQFRSEQKRSLDLTDRLAEAQSGLEHTRQELAQARARSEEWQHTAEQASNETSKARADEASARSDEASARAETVAMQERHDADLRAVESRAASLQGQLDSEQARVAVLSQDVDAARARMAEAESQGAIEADARKTLEVSSNDLAAKLQDERTRSAALADDLAKASATIRQLQASRPQASNVSGTTVSGQGQSMSQPDGRPAQPPVAALTEARPRRMLASIGAPPPATRRLPPAPASDTAKTSSGAENPPVAVQATRKGNATAQPGRPNRDASQASAVRAEPAMRSRPAETHKQVVTVVVDKTPDPDGEGYTSSDYSPYDTSDHTIYIDDVVSRGRTSCGRRACVANRTAVRVARRDTIAR